MVGPSRPAPVLFGDLWLRYSDTVGRQLLTAALGVVSGVLTARLLGPAGRGELTAITLWPFTLLFLGAFGTERATVYFTGKHRSNVSPVVTASACIGAAQTVLVILVGWFVISAALHTHGRAAVRYSLIVLVATPIIRVASLGSYLLLGSLITKWFNLCEAIPPACLSIGVAALFALKIPSIPLIIVAEVVGFGIAAWLCYRVVAKELRPAWEWHPGVSTAMLKYGLKTYAGEITSFMNRRLDQLLISLFLPNEVLGLYTAAVALTDGALCILPRGIGIVTLAIGSNSDPAGAWRWTGRSLLLSSLWLVPGAIGIWFASPWLIPLLFGRSFAGSILPCKILVFGSCAMGFNILLYEAARSMNRPEIPSYAEMAALVITLVLLAALLKPYGAVGAAVASTAAYLSALLLTAGCLFRDYRRFLAQRRERGN